MKSINYIFCHGSGNKFVMIDTIAEPLSGLLTNEFVVNLCANTSSDGLLLLVRHDDVHLAMRMFNTDGSEAEMCGNGIRCIARLADERYLHSPRFTLYSGGKPYPIERCTPLAEGVATYSVDIAIRTSSGDFCTPHNPFIGKVVAELDESLEFTYLNLGNPHLVANVDSIDLDKLAELGERVKSLTEILPNGVNISLYKRLAPQQIFVATYERGVGITASCGTAMTASSTAATLLGLCSEGSQVDVRNRGGAVRCLTTLAPTITTRLSGNATYIAEGTMLPNGDIATTEELTHENQAWSNLLKQL